MGLKDNFFGFNVKKYTELVSKYSDDELLVEEKRQARHKVSGAAAVTAGATLIVVTHGLSVGGIMYGNRTYDVADQKSGIVQSEVKRRGLELYEIQPEDFFVPLAQSVLLGGHSVVADAVVAPN